MYACGRVACESCFYAGVCLLISLQTCFELRLKACLGLLLGTRSAIKQQLKGILCFVVLYLFILQWCIQGVSVPERRIRITNHLPLYLSFFIFVSMCTSFTHILLCLLSTAQMQSCLCLRISSWLLQSKKMNEKSSEECHGAACKVGGSLGLVDGQRCCWIPQTADSEPSRDQIYTQGKPPQTA